MGSSESICYLTVVPPLTSFPSSLEVPEQQPVIRSHCRNSATGSQFGIEMLRPPQTFVVLTKESYRERDGVTAIV